MLQEAFVFRDESEMLYRLLLAQEDRTDPAIARLAADMRATLEHIATTGIAGPQVYVTKRVSGLPD